MDKLSQLAARCDDIYRRIESIAESSSLSNGSKSSAMALLLSVNADLFPKCAAALRATLSGSSSVKT